VTDPLDQDQWMDFTIDDQLLLGHPDAADADCISVQTTSDLRRMCTDVLGEREQPVVGFALVSDGDEDESMLTFADVRAVVGPGVRIYMVGCEDLIEHLADMLGPTLEIQPNSVRIWWPGAGDRCEPTDHPAIAALDGEPRELALEEIARQFDLSRPRVRAHIRLIEDARAFVECELSGAIEQNGLVYERLRDAQLECHGLRVRAETAETSLAATQRPPNIGRPRRCRSSGRARPRGWR
jgi:hypothetical protein